MATDTRELVQRVGQTQAVALLSLTPEQVDHVNELRRLYRQADSDRERAEIRDALLEIVSPNGIGAEGDLAAGVSDATKRRVEEYHYEVGKNIRSRRLAKNMTQSALAIEAGIPQSHVSRLESGRHAPTHITIKKLARALKTRPAILDPGFDT